MLRSIKDLIGYPVVARDGKAGKVKDVLFGDRRWRVRYVDVETRTGFHINFRYLSDAGDGKEASTRRLIETKDLMAPPLGLDRRSLPTTLSVDEIGNCEGFGSHLPAEEKYEMEFRRFFRHGIYDERPLLGSFSHAHYIPPVTAYDHSDKEIREHLDRMSVIAGEHLHSARAVMGYHLVGRSETLGIVGDLIFDFDEWKIGYLALDTRHGIPSRKYLVSMEDVVSLDWASSTINVELEVEHLLSRRRYWAFDPVNVDDTEQAFDYHGKACSKQLMEEVF